MVTSVLAELEGEVDDHFVETVEAAVEVGVNEGGVEDGGEDGHVVETAKGGDGMVAGLLLDVPEFALVAVFSGDVCVRSTVAPDAEALLILVLGPGRLAAEEDLNVPGFTGAVGLAAL